MKNDAFSDNFPNKFFFTEALRSGFLPLWNPYLNFGFPVYADPGFAFWNPITWLFGAIIGYNAYTLTIEVLVYIYLAGVCMYRLGRCLRFTITTSITIAAMYMCSGFFCGEIQHINFLTSAAFLPFLIQQFLILFKEQDYKNACITAVAYYTVFAGGHPAIPIATVYFLSTLTLSLFLFNAKARHNWKSLLWYHSVSILIFIILYSPAIYSYLSILEVYGRGAPVNQSDAGAMFTGFSPSSYLSFIYPFATTKNALFFTDDLAMRNCYFSIAGCVLALTEIKSKNYMIRSLFITAGVMLIFSSGGILKTVIYSKLPLLKYIKTNGEFRVFVILCFCLISGHALNSFVLKRRNPYPLFRKILITILVITFCLFVYVFANNLNHLTNLISSIFTNVGTGLKGIIDRLIFTDVLLISVMLQLIFISMLLAARWNLKRLSFIIILDLTINAMMYLPFSGVGIVTLSQIQKTYNKSEKGLPIPSLIAIKNIDSLPEKLSGLAGSWSFYNKKIGISKMQDYPSYFSSTERYFSSTLPEVINNLPYVFFKTDIERQSNISNDKKVNVRAFSPQKIAVAVDVPQNDTLVLLQNFFKFWQVKVDGHPATLNKSFITFMSVPLSTGRHEVEFSYHDNWLVFFIFFWLVGLIILFFFIIKNKSRPVKVQAVDE